MFWWNMYVIVFKKPSCAVKLNQQGINSPVNSASAPQATQKFPFIGNFRTSKETIVAP